jgi:hypothetical protein
MTDDRSGRPARPVTVLPDRGGAGRLGQVSGRPGQLPNVLQARLAHARETAARLRLSPEATAAVQDAVGYDPYVLDSGLLQALAPAGLAERAALLMPYAAEGPYRQAHVLGQVTGGALAAQDGRLAEAASWLTQAEQNVAAARTHSRRVRAPALRPTALLAPPAASATDLEPGL